MKPKVFSSSEALLLTIFCGPFMGAYILYNNFKALGYKSKANIALIFGFLFSVAVIVGLMYLPARLLGSLRYTVSPILGSIVYTIIKFGQEKKIEAYEASGPTKELGLKILGIGILSIALVFGVAYAKYAIADKHIFNKKQYEARQLVKAQNDYQNSFKLYVSGSGKYSIKMPSDFVLNETKSDTDKFISSNTETPFNLYVASLGIDQALVYSDDQTSLASVNSMVKGFENTIQSTIGDTDTTAVSGAINIAGTKHKYGIFSTGINHQNKERTMSVQIVLIPKNDGSSLMVYVILPTDLENTFQTAIDYIFKSVEIKG